MSSQPHDPNYGGAAIDMRTTTLGIVVILPVLNEVNHIRRLLDGIRRHLAGHPLTICVIDDGSHDGTMELLQEEIARRADVHLIRRTKVTRGSQRGSALQAGLEWSLQNTNHEVLVEMDGDLSHMPEELPIGVSLISSGKCDIAIASKFLKGSAVLNRPLRRRAVSFLGNLLVRSMITWRVRDYSNGYRFYNRGAGEILCQHHLVHGSPIYLTEALAVWLSAGMRVVEFPSTYVGRYEGLSKLRWIDLVQAIFAVFEISWRYHVTGFRERATPEVAVKQATE